jgi:hypothetical protein
MFDNHPQYKRMPKLVIEGLEKLKEIERIDKISLPVEVLTEDAVRSLAKLDNIEMLSLWSTGDLFDAFPTHLLAPLQNIRVLRLSPSGYMSPPFPSLAGLEELDLEAFGNESEEVLIQISKLPKLRVLTVRTYSIKEFSGFAHLEELHLTADVSDEALKQIKDLPNIKKVVIYERGKETFRLEK